VASRAEWVYETYITPDTEALTAREGAALTKLQVDLALGAAKFANVAGLDYDTGRKLGRLRNKIVRPAPVRAGAADELAGLSAKITGMYGAGKGTLNGKPINGSDIEAAMGEERDPAKLKEMWVSW
ncbi:peptidase M2 family protein, partial [Escherichia coli]|nr:peptidase M2 family protein [Escherichia coli]